MEYEKGLSEAVDNHLVMKPLRDRLSYEVKPIHKMRKSKEGKILNRSMIGSSIQFEEVEQKHYDEKLNKVKRVLTMQKKSRASIRKPSGHSIPFHVNKASSVNVARNNVTAKARESTQSI